MRKLKLIMPMCGEGSRFVNAGYDKPKPLIDAGGLPLFVRSVECIRVEFDEKIFLTRQQHGLNQIFKVVSRCYCNRNRPPLPGHSSNTVICS